MMRSSSGATARCAADGIVSFVDCALLTCVFGCTTSWPLRPVRISFAALPDHFVHVHVDARVAASLPHVEREFAVEFARERAVAGLHDRIGDIGLERADLGIGHGAGLLDCEERAVQARMKDDGQMCAADTFTMRCV